MALVQVRSLCSRRNLLFPPLFQWGDQELDGEEVPSPVTSQTGLAAAHTQAAIYNISS